MSKTLLVGNTASKLVKMYALNLNIYVGTEVICLKNHEEVIQFLNLAGSVDLIIAKAMLEDKECAIHIYKHLKENTLEIPLVVLGEDLRIKNSVITLDAGAEIRQVIKAAAGVLGVTAKKMMEQVTGDYHPIPLSYFAALSESICDIYLRVKKSDTEYQYIKRIHSKEKIDDDLLEKYRQEGVAKLYIPTSMRLKFANTVTEQTLAKLRDPNLTDVEMIRAIDKGTAIAYAKIHDEGFSEETVDLTNQCIKSLNKSVANYPRLGKLLQKLVEQKTGYMYRHCQIINHITTFLIDNSDWGNDEQKEKMGFVNFFHDIPFTADNINTEKLVQIETQAQFLNTEMTEQEKNLVKHHALLAMQLVVDFPHAPLGADVIIKQHHGVYNGTGFSDIVPANISYLAVVFIIAEHFARILLNLSSWKNVDFKVILSEMRKHYKTAQQLKLLDTLQSFKF